jgi:hypothetical protein
MTSILKIGTSVGALAAFDALATPVKDPATVSMYPYAETKRLGDGTYTGRGKPYCVLYWKNIIRAQRDQLRTFCTGASASVYFTLPTNDSNLTVANYLGIMVWPVTEKYYLNIITDFTININYLIAQ